MYLTYDEYTGYGGTLSETEYPKVELQVRRHLDYLMDSRLANTTFTDDIKLAIYTLISLETEVGASAQAGGQVKSFSNDGYSETYQTMGVVEYEQTFRAKVKELFWGVLDNDGVPVLYRGVE